MLRAYRWLLRIAVTSLDRHQNPLHKSSDLAPKEGGGRQESGINWFYFRSMFLAMKNTLAGRSPKRRMKYGYHSVPKGT